LAASAYLRGNCIIMGMSGEISKSQFEQAEKEIIKEEERKELLAKSEISLIIDTYDDIFSDFDPRPFSHRTISDDFLEAARKALRGVREGTIELRFMIPKIERVPEQEVLIKKRLHEHFRKHALILEDAKRKTIWDGAKVAVVGFVILLCATYIVSLELEGIFYSLLLVILEPSGWFTAWSGMETIVYTSKDKDAEIGFYNRMSRSEIIFNEY